MLSLVVPYMEEFLKVNDRKARIDFKIRKTFKEFWIRRTFSCNDCGQAGDGDVLEGVDSDSSVTVGGDNGVCLHDVVATG